jgi:predicted HAD superfamily Cof-like phosphohydrolase
MLSKLNQVAIFHKAFKQSGDGTGAMTLLKKDESILRFELMKEENEEYLEACQDGNIVEIADALGDQLYILCGTILKHGLHHKIDEVFNEIQRSNMTKLDEDGKPIFREDGKILKGKGYDQPHIESILFSKD